MGNGYWSPYDFKPAAVVQTDTDEFFGFTSPSVARSYCKHGGYTFGLWRLKERKDA